MSLDIQNDRPLVLEAIKHDGSALQFASSDIRRDQDIVLEAGKKHRWALQFADRELFDDASFLLRAIELDSAVLQLATMKMRGDRGFMIEAGENQSPLPTVCHAKTTERSRFRHRSSETGLACLAICGGPELLGNAELMLEAFCPGSAFTRVCCTKLKKKRQLLEALKLCNSVLHFAEPEARQDRDLVLAAVKISGQELKFAAPDLRRDREIALAAVKQDVMSWRYVASELRDDPELNEVVACALGFTGK